MKLTLFYRHKLIKKDGTATAYLRYLGSNKTACDLPLVAVPPDCWDAKKSRVARKHKEFVKLNLIIEKSFNRAENIILDAQANGENLSVSEFKDRYLNAGEKSKTLLQYTRDFIAEMGDNYAETTKRNYRNFANKIELFAKTATVNEANTLSFIERFEAYMQKGGDLSKNGRNKQHATLKAILNRAKAKGVIATNAYAGYKLSYDKVSLSYLTSSELAKLERYYNSEKCTGGNRHTLTAFLFSCYTGLRYSDMAKLKPKNIEEFFVSGKTQKAVRIRMQKTNEEVVVPLTAKALSIIDTAILPDAVLFKVFTNQVVNRQLKAIAKDSGIAKPLTFHTARHTFATISLSLGIDLKVISKLLGHSKIAMTEIYAKVIDSSKFDAMEAWDKM